MDDDLLLLFISRKYCLLTTNLTSFNGYLRFNNGYMLSILFTIANSVSLYRYSPLFEDYIVNEPILNQIINRQLFND